MKVQIAIQCLASMAVNTNDILTHIPQEAELVHSFFLLSLGTCSFLKKRAPPVGIVARGAGNLADIGLLPVLIKYWGIPPIFFVVANNIAD